MNLDEARTLANVNDRAQRLFEDGYRIRYLDTHRYLIRSEQGATYTLDRSEDIDRHTRAMVQLLREKKIF